MADSMGRASRATISELGELQTEPMHQPCAYNQEDRIDLMAYRWENGLNIYTGEPLTGADHTEWLRLRAEDNAD